MARIREIQATAALPATDDYAVIDGVTHSVRKIRLGGAATLNYPASGDALSSQVVRRQPATGRRADRFRGGF
jgi:hypothetical protein